MADAINDDCRWMLRALELARQGEGHVEPNPMVGAVIVSPQGKRVSEGFHHRFGAPHAEAEALFVAGDLARGATLYVTLEPCCHTGKTPPCTRAIIAAGIARVVVAMRDPYPQVDGGGLRELTEAGIAWEVGCCQAEARALLAPYLKLVTTGRPWVIAKWAMTLDGKLATHTGSSQWISGEASRAIVHQLRGRVDAILVGQHTAKADDPLLTARPAGPRTATRIVWGDVALDSQLARTAGDAPLVIATDKPNAPGRYHELEARGAELLWLPSDSLPDRAAQLEFILAELGRRRCTNLLVEGGGRLLGRLLDAGEIDEVHAFIAPKLAGGRDAVTPIAGDGIADMRQAIDVADGQWREVGGDLYFSGRVKRQ